MKKALLLLALNSLVLPALAQAAEEIEGAVPVELVKLFLNLPEDGGLYRDLPEGFALRAVPAGFELLGAVDQRSSRAAYLETSLEIEAAEDAIAEALAPAGWLRMPAPRAMPALGIRGFVSGQGDSRYPLQLCHDAQGIVSLSRVPAQGREVLALRHTRFFPGQSRSCREQIDTNQRIAATRGPGGPLGEYMPRLELPREADFQGRRAGPVGGFSGGNDEMESRTDLAIDWEPARVAAHFEEQLAAQGWTRDGQWATERVAGGSWTREADGVNLLGMLSVVRKEEGQHNLRFRLMSVETATATAPTAPASPAP